MSGQQKCRPIETIGCKTQAELLIKNCPGKLLLKVKSNIETGINPDTEWIVNFSDDEKRKAVGTGCIHKDNTYETSIGFFTIFCDLFEKSALEFNKPSEGL